tara:strand:- start:571 stop:732 length:162 start_codon:yes stop_codon:yes gene_type:complete
MIKVGTLVKIFAANQHPPGIVMAIHQDKRIECIQVFWNNTLQWVSKCKAEVLV